VEGLAALRPNALQCYMELFDNMLDMIAKQLSSLPACVISNI
jgi:hypothetical protein